MKNLMPESLFNKATGHFVPTFTTMTTRQEKIQETQII